MKSHLPLVIEETAGINRTREPLSLGVPFPEGLLHDPKKLWLHPHGTLEDQWPLQSTPLATWPDGSLKWALIDFSATLSPHHTLSLDLTWDAQPTGIKLRPPAPITITHTANSLSIDTGTATFWLNRTLLQPFERVVLKGNDILTSTHSYVRLVDTAGRTFSPHIEAIEVEADGPLRATIKITGAFHGETKGSFASFCSRLHFFAQSTLVKVEFTLHNPRAAKHPGGLWDLGDAGSVFFKDLSLAFSLVPCDSPAEILLDLAEEWEAPSPLVPTPEGTPDISTLVDLLVYQDSSGGRNWQSRNHVNKDGEVKTSFQGFATLRRGSLAARGHRAAPIVGVSSKAGNISGTIRHFWQNFPSAIEADGTKLTIRLFPQYFNDCFELQGGERKTHTIYLEFAGPDEQDTSLAWTRQPLLSRTPPEWYAATGAIASLVPRNQIPPGPVWDLIDSAVYGEQSFFQRREIIDEYGWRNFGDFYADHEAVGHEEPKPLISHYNNQYDGLWGCLLQYLATGDSNWFRLGDELSAHLKDIDIYHTDADRPEYNHGMFWHTEHYIDAETATHRCFSRKHAGKRNLAHYGGGPSLSHNYSSGLLLHYYLTGSPSSREAVLELANFVATNLALEQSILNLSVKKIKKAITLLKQGNITPQLVDTNKVYGLDGPGRASGNALNTLLDAFVLSGDHAWNEYATDLITRCISAEDDLTARDLLDIENRWMYTVFLQALGKFFELPQGKSLPDSFRQEARCALLHYAGWMVTNERFYLDQREKLEFPNETWAAQDLRKCNVLLYAWLYADKTDRTRFLKSATSFFEGGLKQLLAFETCRLTRPIVLLLQNIMMMGWNKLNPHMPNQLGMELGNKESFPQKAEFRFARVLKNEILCIMSWRKR